MTISRGQGIKNGLSHKWMPRYQKLEKTIHNNHFSKNIKKERLVSLTYR
uniref:Uncharacterized protein n=1 Tax=Rhizophora mucronata TaxID=61149 RepID=A0A2P2N2K7_RHIMU